LNYDDFLKSKTAEHNKSGIDPDAFPDFMRDDQKYVVDKALRAGKYCIFAECGLGKTLDELEWSRQVNKHTNKPVMIFAPLCVGIQTQKEGERFGYGVNRCLGNGDVKNGINIANYERIEKFDCSQFSGVVLDESSILKNFQGKTRNLIIGSFVNTPYKLACSATPAPNDFMELGNHSEFIGVMSRAEMLAMYFVHDGGETQKWRLKGHAEGRFWDWVRTWSSTYSFPSDLDATFDDSGFVLPSLNIVPEYVGCVEENRNLLGSIGISDLNHHRRVKRESVGMKAEYVKNKLVGFDDYIVVWCDLNLEADAMEKAIGGVQLKGSQSIEEKEDILWGFTNGDIKRLVTKQKITSFGLNWQHCNNTIFSGSSYSYESTYQAIKRFHRFGQKREVTATWVMSDEEYNVFDILDEKMQQHKEFKNNG